MIIELQDEVPMKEGLKPLPASLPEATTCKLQDEVPMKEGLKLYYK